MDLKSFKLQAKNKVEILSQDVNNRSDYYKYDEYDGKYGTYLENRI